jgi:hypothetical protein
MATRSGWTPLEALEAARAGNTAADDLESMAAEALRPYPDGRPLAGAGPSNDDRARWAGDAAEVFAALTGQDLEADGRWEIAGDLIANLMHWCDREPGVETRDGSEALLDRGRMHYRGEGGGGHEPDGFAG